MRTRWPAVSTSAPAWANRSSIRGCGTSTPVRARMVRAAWSTFATPCGLSTFNFIADSDQEPRNHRRDR